MTCETILSNNKPVLVRPIPFTPRQMVSNTKSKKGRQACSKCSPPPIFQSEQKKPLQQAESSFGRMFRYSTERMLAKDLRDSLCSSGVCPSFNQSAWKRGQFMRNFMHTPKYLFLGLNQTHDTTPTSPTWDDSSQWTNKPWVYCPTNSALKTSSNCKGVISRSQWLKEKTTTCPRMVRDLSSNNNGTDSMSRTPFCNIDATTTRLCQAITDARLIVSNANCIASGDPKCMPSPFVYTPSLYDTTNQAWVYDTVTSFYKKINGNSCPMGDRDQQALIEYNRKYQLSCPANYVYIFEGILRIVRVIADEIALLLSTVMSMALKILGMLLPGGSRENFKQMVLSDWAWLKKQSKSFMFTLSDLFIDMLMNAGNLGAKLMAFLDRVCVQINSYINWFLNIWCNYIEKYMGGMLAGLRRAMGMIGAGFEMLNDFMDEVFQGILPASFVAKYGNSLFQSLMAEKYSKPTAHEDKVKGVKNVPLSVNARPVSRLASARNTISQVAKTTSSVAGTVARVAVPLFIAYEGFNAISGLVGMARDSDLRKLYPSNFSLFDFSDVVNVLDDMATFIVQDTTCYSYQVMQRANLTYQFFPCLKLDISQYQNTTAGTTSIDATLCWADASPSLGQSSLFSCTASSTCCETSACLNFVMCDSCPVPALTGVSKFACNPLQKKCMCGQVQSIYDKCSANRQCSQSSQCVLVSSLNSISFGTIPCANCPSTGMVMCMLPSTGLPGQCSCVMDHSVGYDM